MKIRIELEVDVPEGGYAEGTCRSGSKLRAAAHAVLEEGMQFIKVR